MEEPRVCVAMRPGGNALPPPACAAIIARSSIDFRAEFRHCGETIVKGKQT